MNKPKPVSSLLLNDRATPSSLEDELVRSTWESLSKGKHFMQKELQETFAFDFSDIFPHMAWDDTSSKQ